MVMLKNVSEAKYRTPILNVVMHAMTKFDAFIPVIPFVLFNFSVLSFELQDA